MQLVASQVLEYEEISNDNATEIHKKNLKYTFEILNELSSIKDITIGEKMKESTEGQVILGTCLSHNTN